MYDYYDRWHDFYWHMGSFFNVVILFLVVLGIVYWVQSFARSSVEGPKKQDTAMDTLKKRYASGEINAEEFERKKKDLGS